MVKTSGEITKLRNKNEDGKFVMNKIVSNEINELILEIFQRLEREHSELLTSILSQEKSQKQAISKKKFLDK